MPLKKFKLPNLDKIKKEKSKPKKEEQEENVSKTGSHVTFLPKSEYDDKGTPRLNIPDIDDTNLSISTSNILHKDIEHTNKILDDDK